MALMGPSGHRQDHALEPLGGLDTPTSGEVIVCGQTWPRSARRGAAGVRPRAYVFLAYNCCRCDRYQTSTAADR